jgi:murein DD-endopeptidase MepM/ murein hydrolase activator NlpD
MQRLRAELDATSARIEQLRQRQFALQDRIQAAEAQRRRALERTAELREVAVERARELYLAGTPGLLEALLGAEDIGEVADRAQMLAEVSTRDNAVFARLARARAELRLLDEGLKARRAQLAETLAALRDENAELQERLAAAEADFARARRLARRTPAPSPVLVTAAPAPAPDTSQGMACPVAGPVSFVDSWGAPRSGGRTHEGVDMMADYGTPVVAIVSGTITYAGYGSSAGNWLILSGNDGNSYWYMHNQTNLVTGGPVEVGQQIATVGDTGNAAGTPHLHFEYHPGGGGPVNPYPLVASIC